MKPTVGRIVHYKLSQEDAKIINRAASDGSYARRMMAMGSLTVGVMTHQGSFADVSDILPMVITRVNQDGTINGQVFLDGNGSAWVSYVEEGAKSGTWSWPPRE